MSDPNNMPPPYRMPGQAPAQVSGQSPPQAKAQIVMVVEHTGATWTVNSSVPGDETTVIMRMFYIDGCVEVFALPKPGSALDGMGQGLHFTLTPYAIKLIASATGFESWKRLLAETEDLVNDDGHRDDDRDRDQERDDDEREDEPEEEPEQPAQPSAYAQPHEIPGAPAPIQQPNYVPSPQATVPAPIPEPVS